MGDVAERFLCIASYEKGQDFLRQCAELGVKPTLLTVDKLRDADWPRDVLEEVVTMPPGLTVEQILNTVSYMARARRFDRIIALDEFDIETAAQIREHMRIRGMGVTASAYYRDKLAMRIGAQESGFLVPEFCRVLNYDELREFMERSMPATYDPNRWRERLRHGKRVYEADPEAAAAVAELSTMASPRLSE